MKSIFKSKVFIIIAIVILVAIISFMVWRSLKIQSKVKTAIAGLNADLVKLKSVSGSETKEDIDIWIKANDQLVVDNHLNWIAKVVSASVTKNTTMMQQIEREVAWIKTNQWGKMLIPK